jgi:RecA/RadA recombinase
MHLCFLCRIDELLDGGLFTMEITEVVGSVAAGKTQVCALYSL